MIDLFSRSAQLYPSIDFYSPLQSYYHVSVFGQNIYKLQSYHMNIVEEIGDVVIGCTLHAHFTIIQILAL